MHLVVGASGVLGSRIVERLLTKQSLVRAVTRNPAKLDSIKAKGAEVVQGDLLDPSWMDSALKDVKYLILSTHGLVPPSRKNNIVAVDDAGNRRIIDAAKRAGIEKVIFTSALLANPESPVTFGRIKYKIEEYIKASGLKYTMIRPPAFIETHALFLIGESFRKSGKVSFLGTGSKPIRWISAEDVADFIVESIDSSEQEDTIQSITGPDVLSRIQVLEIFERVLGKQAKRSHLPMGAMKVMRILFKPINPGMSYLFEAAIAEENLPAEHAGSNADFHWIAPKNVENVIEKWTGT